jgi:hypothetical protein
MSEEPTTEMLSCPDASVIRTSVRIFPRPGSAEETYMSGTAILVVSARAPAATPTKTNERNAVDNEVLGARCISWSSIARDAILTR